MNTGSLWSRVVHALVGERADHVRNAFFNWEPMKGRKEWGDVSFLLPDDETSNAVINVLETVNGRRRQTREERVAVVDVGQNE